MWFALHGLFRARRSVDEYLETLERQGLTQTVAELRSYASVL
jgi:hypothetical protein